MRVFEPLKSHERIYQRWLAGEPEVIRKVAERFDPWTLYLMRSTGKKVMVRAFVASGDLRMVLLRVSTIDVDAETLLGVESISNVDPDDLEPVP
jgi:hypothetical protein